MTPLNYIRITVEALQKYCSVTIETLAVIQLSRNMFFVPSVPTHDQTTATEYASEIRLIRRYNRCLNKSANSLAELLGND